MIRRWAGIGVVVMIIAAAPALGQRQMERLGRGLVAMRHGDGRVYLSWRMLGTDTELVTFNVYRSIDGAPPVKLNAEPITRTTDFIAPSTDTGRINTFTVRAIVAGVEQAPSAPFVLRGTTGTLPYLAIPIDPPPPGQTPDGQTYTPTANDASVGDLDGDGEYEIILKWEPSNAKNSGHDGPTGNVFIDGYTLAGRRLWRIDLGRNVRAGPTYTQFIVYDFDGDGRAEVATKTAPGTRDGTGKFVLLPGDAADANFIDPRGRVLSGPEYLTIFNGQTGAAMATVPFEPARGNVTDWGDGYGQRVDQLLACAAYLDGVRPSLVTCRGYYLDREGKIGKTMLAAWDWREGKLVRRWLFEANPARNTEYLGQGNHNLSVADVDGDGRDEIVYGAMVVDDDGKGLYSTGWGHGDAMHVSDLDPGNPGLEVFNIQEKFGPQGMNLRDARTGKPLFLIPSIRATTSGSDAGEGPGRGVSFNIDPRHPGNESWAMGAGMAGMYDVRGNRISIRRPHSCNFAVWWDGDLLRELLDNNYIAKWNWQDETDTTLLTAEGCVSINGTKSNASLSADILGDWREEVIWPSVDNTELRIYTTTIPSRHRLVTLMHDPQYRLAVAWQNVMYNQPPHPSFHLDEAAVLPPRQIP